MAPGIIARILDSSLASMLPVAAVGPQQALAPFVIYFLLVSLVIALVSSAVRIHDPRSIARETTRFFASIVIGIFIFCLIVFGLEWLFIRPLI